MLATVVQAASSFGSSRGSLLDAPTVSNAAASLAVLAVIGKRFLRRLHQHRAFLGIRNAPRGQPESIVDSRRVAVFPPWVNMRAARKREAST